MPGAGGSCYIALQPRCKYGPAHTFASEQNCSPEVPIVARLLMIQKVYSCKLTSLVFTYAQCITYTHSGILYLHCFQTVMSFCLNSLMCHLTRLLYCCRWKDWLCHPVMLIFLRRIVWYMRGEKDSACPMHLHTILCCLLSFFFQKRNG